MSDQPINVVGMAIDGYRSKVDQADVTLLEELANRFKATDAIGRLKSDQGIAVHDPEREASIIVAYRRLAADYDLEPDFVESIWNLIFEESKRRQQA